MYFKPSTIAFFALFLSAHAQPHESFASDAAPKLGLRGFNNGGNQDARVFTRHPNHSLYRRHPENIAPLELSARSPGFGGSVAKGAGGVATSLAGSGVSGVASGVGSALTGAVLQAAQNRGGKKQRREAEAMAEAEANEVYEEILDLIAKRYAEPDFEAEWLGA
ncbi:hypothetical protein MMC10_006827 [Thelotrema lepadinum]|nr:hypothetical protein [Thelotrema lepadinum]